MSSEMLVKPSDDPHIRRLGRVAGSGPNDNIVKRTDPGVKYVFVFFGGERIIEDRDDFMVCVVLDESAKVVRKRVVGVNEKDHCILKFGAGIIFYYLSSIYATVVWTRWVYGNGSGVQCVG